MAVHLCPSIISVQWRPSASPSTDKSEASWIPGADSGRTVGVDGARRLPRETRTDVSWGSIASRPLWPVSGQSEYTGSRTTERRQVSEGTGKQTGVSLNQPAAKLPDLRASAPGRPNLPGVTDHGNPDSTHAELNLENTVASNCRLAPKVVIVSVRCRTNNCVLGCQNPLSYRFYKGRRSGGPDDNGQFRTRAHRRGTQAH